MTELVAVQTAASGAGAAEKYGNASVWDDPQAMLLAVKPDAVSVCSPNRFLLRTYPDGAGSGLPCDARKPPAMTVEQARGKCAIPRANRARRAGLRLSPHRFALDTQQLREQVTNGVFGRDYSYHRPPRPCQRRSRLGCLY